MDVTRDVVFGVMALRNSLIDPTQLARAMAEQFQSGAQLPEVVVSKGWMSVTQCADLNRELDGALRQHGGDLQRVMDQLGSAPRGDLASDVDPGSDRLDEHTVDMVNVASLPSASDGHDAPKHTLTLPPTGDGVDLQGAISPGDVQGNTLDFTPEQCSRYTLTRVYGEGGLGQVWLAIDPSLKREVALKNIRPGKDTALARQRLIREAQITGQLEHPNIIPIYELEQASPEATPYYTMRFLRGKTLQEKIASYHKHRKAGKVDPLELPELLQAFVDICQAIAYAGSRGVMHRDLKPQNIMLGDFGEVLVLDWGLAKYTGQAELGSGAERAPVRLAPASVESQTVAGQVMGSPAYMAPEQATGRVDLMDSRTDIYGLGAILFAILTGKGPHRGERTGNTAKDTRALLKKISQGETPRARDFDPTVPQPLDAICLHAMAKKPEDRYQNAAELARDVQRFLADEPVSVYREPWQQRAWRWARRHRARTQSFAAALVLTVVVSVVATIIVARAQSETAKALEAETKALKAEKTALAAAEAAKREATERFRQARRAVDESFTGISQALENYPGVQRLRTELLENAARDYERFAAERSDDPELRLEFALALIRLGDVRRLLAAFPESDAAYHRAIEVFESFLEEEPDSPQIQLALAQCYNALGMLHLTAGSLDDGTEAVSSFSTAGEAYQTAAKILTQLTGEATESPEFRRTKAQTLANQGVLLSRTSEFDAAIDALQRAAREFDGLANDLNEPRDRSELAKTRISLGELLVETGRNRDAESELEKAIDFYEVLVRQEPDSPGYLQGLADARKTLGNTLLALGREADRIALYETCITDYTALIKTRPDVPKYRQRLASTETNLAQTLFMLGRNDEAKTQAEIALGLAIDLVNEHPGVAENHVLEASSLVTLGQILRDLQDLTLAETACAKAAEKCTELIEAIPGQSGYFRLRGEVRNNMGTVQLLNSDYAAARQTFVDARSDFDKALELAPGDAWARDGLAWSMTYLGDALRLLDRAKEAKTFYELALQMLRKNDEEPRRQYQLAHLLVNCLDEELRDPTEAAVIADRISRQDPTNANYLTLQAAAAYRLGQWQPCLAKLDEAAIVQLRGKSSIDFWRAMALYRQSPENPQAKLVYDRACAQMDRQAPGDLKLVRLRDEAAALLGSAGEVR